MGAVYKYLGLECAAVVPDDVALRKQGLNMIEAKQQRREAYLADISYVTARQLCFDYLFDQLALGKDNLVRARLGCLQLGRSGLLPCSHVA